MTSKKTMVGRVLLEVDIEGFELYEQEIIGYLLHEMHYKYKSRVPLGYLECYKSGADHVCVNATVSGARMFEKHKRRYIPKAGT